MLSRPRRSKFFSHCKHIIGRACALPGPTVDTPLGIPDGYFEQRGKDGKSQFDRDCNKILYGFKSKFQSDMGLGRDKYLNTFSIKSWSELCTVEKDRHNLSHCTRCFECHEQQQRSFPLKPIYQPQPVVDVDRNALQRQGIKKFTANVLH